MTFKQFIFSIVVFLPCIAFSQSQRRLVLLDTGWLFHFAYDMRTNAPKEKVSVPHTWNAKEALEGKMNYTRTNAIYEKKLNLSVIDTSKRYFLFFDGVNSYAQVLVNNHFVGEHKGGYTKFCFEITSFLRSNGNNTIQVQVSNAARPDILPLTGDFNVYGGIHRPVYLLETGKDCISSLDFASSGVYATPYVDTVNNKLGNVTVKTMLSLQTNQPLTVKTTILDAKNRIVNTASTMVHDASSLTQKIAVANPQCWDGIRNPYLYAVKVQLLDGNSVLDEVMQPLGFRQYKVDPQNGLILNDRYLDLHGFGFHEDVAGKGSAVSTADLQKDMQLVSEVGATSLRLTHYPHSSYIYNYADSNGIVLWSEIPLVGPGGYTGAGYINNPELKAQALQVLQEMIHQNYNHPSVLFWGLFNELKLDHDDPIPFLTQLDSVCKALDPIRLTTCATFLDGDQFNKVSDVIAWNKYYGWYGGKFSDMGKWADLTHHNYPNKAIAVSEYGAGASIHDHDEGTTAPNPSGHFHPEEWQTAYHEAHWQEFKTRPFVWGKYIWDLADFGSAIRTEGDHNAINDKGLVTYDRKTKKDAFYFYKANWNSEPMVYIAERRYINRKNREVRVKVFANTQYVKLFVNGKLIGEQKPDDNKTAVWQNVVLKKGKNIASVEAKVGDKMLKDACEWNLMDN
ncbi:MULTISPECIES: glycoside hydrolase family 2 protein [Chitinophagaceae]